MLKSEISEFKRFLATRGVDKVFESLYNEYRFEDNPNSLYSYYALEDSLFIIVHAFDFNRIKADNRFNRNVWQKLNREWLNVMLKSKLSKLEDRMKAIEEKAPEKPKNPFDGIELAEIPIKKKRVEMPKNREIRMCTCIGNSVVFNITLSDKLQERKLDSLCIMNDNKSGRFLFVFGKGLEYKIRDYSAGTMCVTHKDIIKYLEKYLGFEFDKQKAYFIHLLSPLLSNDGTKIAVPILKQFEVSDR